MRRYAGVVLVSAAIVAVLGLGLRSSLDEPAEFTFVNYTEPRSLDPGLVTGTPEGYTADDFSVATFGSPPIVPSSSRYLAATSPDSKR